MELKKHVEKHLNSVLFSHINITSYTGDNSLQSLDLFSQKMREMLYGMMRGSQNASELVPNLPFWLNPEKRCVESATKSKNYINGTFNQHFPVKWEDALHQAFVANCKLVKINIIDI